ncbi:MAG: hypothetical protein LBQ02_02765 [Candidatus Nomurabacteria bacterium]|jgi:hypothetical protein|nr:hypothetical protein [Candidatus Nomurabacteria bacterium]
MNDENNVMPDVIDFAENGGVPVSAKKPEVTVIDIPSAPSADAPQVTLPSRQNLSVDDAISPNSSINQLSSLSKDDLTAELQGIIADLESKTARLRQIANALSGL